MTSSAFRSRFPALERWAWLDTPGSPPAHVAVAERLGQALADWTSGEFDWRDWDASVESAKGLFAGLLGVQEGAVAAMGSVAEAVTAVVRSLPPGSIVVSQGDYRSVILPITLLASDKHDVIIVPSSHGLVDSRALVSAVRDDTVLVACSDTLTSTGERLDFQAISAAAHAVGAAVFADLTQSFGVLRHDLEVTGVDFVAVHGYKWLLCPRGAAWLYVAPHWQGSMVPPQPSWKSTDPPFGYFGAPASLPESAGRLDTSPAWLAWIGAIPALEAVLALPRPAVEAHCVRLARAWREEAESMGYRAIGPATESHIAVVDIGARDPARLAAAFRRQAVKITINGSRLRIGVHYFNDSSDIERSLEVMSRFI